MVVLEGDDVELEPRQVFTHLVPQVHEGLAGVEDGGAHAEGGGGGFRRQAGLLDGPLGIVHDALGMLIEDLPRLGEGDAMVGAKHQLQVQMLFQSVDLLDHRRGGEVQRLCRLVEAAAVSHLDKGVQLWVIHGVSPLSVLTFGYSHGTKSILPCQGGRG